MILLTDQHFIGLRANLRRLTRSWNCGVTSVWGNIDGVIWRVSAVGTSKSWQYDAADDDVSLALTEATKWIPYSHISRLFGRTMTFGSRLLRILIGIYGIRFPPPDAM